MTQFATWVSNHQISSEHHKMKSRVKQFLFTVYLLVRHIGFGGPADHRGKLAISFEFPRFGISVLYSQKNIEKIPDGVTDGQILYQELG